MKYLGIDYGTKHVGIALSDSGGNVAMPHQVIPNDAQFESVLLDIVREHGIETIVIGESQNMDGDHNSVQSEIDSFVTHFATKTDVPIVSMNELFSSRQAKWGTEHLIRFNPRNADRRKLHQKQKRIDDKAATIILQSYLDSQA